MGWGSPPPPPAPPCTPSDNHPLRGRGDLWRREGGGDKTEAYIPRNEDYPAGVQPYTCAVIELITSTFLQNTHAPSYSSQPWI